MYIWVSLDKAAFKATIIESGSSQPLIDLLIDLRTKINWCGHAQSILTTA